MKWTVILLPLLHAIEMKGPIKNNPTLSESDQPMEIEGRHLNLEPLLSSVNIQKSYLVPFNIKSGRKSIESNLGPVKMNVEIEEKDHKESDRIPVINAVEIESGEQNLVPVKYLTPVRIDNKQYLVPVKYLTPVRIDNQQYLVPVNMSRFLKRPKGSKVLRAEPWQRYTWCYDNAFYYSRCSEACRIAVHEGCKEYKCTDEFELKKHCDKRCGKRYSVKPRIPHK